mmetsp:Transcript_1535/g.4526  ORF Transcript_1535/g.4526 Transcript_1535/m.4526 type:complete len:291 (+) Transcript_1535:98-970(+)
MQFVADLRSKASAAVLIVQAKLGEAKVKAAGALAKATEPITSRISAVLLKTQSAKSAALERAYQARAAVLDLAASKKAVVVGLRANVQAKGIRACVQDLATSAQLLARESAASAKVRAGELYTATGELVSQKSFQTTAASATAGAVTLGAGGAATGAMTGGLAGAVAGLPLALFTFGLSIPAGAVVGGGAGLVLGTAAGATTGFLGGGVAGYGVYQKKDDIRGAELVKGRAVKSVEYAKDVVVAAKGRLERAGTGETAENTDRDRSCTTATSSASEEVVPERGQYSSTQL